MSTPPREGHETHRPSVHRELLAKMLESHPGIAKDGDVYTPAETTQLEVLLKSGGGAPAPLSKVDRVTLHEEFVAVEAAEATSLLPYAALAGLRVAAREKVRGAGFMR